jgi:hypothetical protein
VADRRLLELAPDGDVALLRVDHLAAEYGGPLSSGKSPPGLRGAREQRGGRAAGQSAAVDTRAVRRRSSSPARPPRRARSPPSPSRSRSGSRSRTRSPPRRRVGGGGGGAGRGRGDELGRVVWPVLVRHISGKEEWMLAGREVFVSLPGNTQPGELRARAESEGFTGGCSMLLVRRCRDPARPFCALPARSRRGWPPTGAGRASSSPSLWVRHTHMLTNLRTSTHECYHTCALPRTHASNPAPAWPPPAVVKALVMAGDSRGDRGCLTLPSAREAARLIETLQGKQVGNRCVGAWQPAGSWRRLLRASWVGGTSASPAARLPLHLRSSCVEPWGRHWPALLWLLHTQLPPAWVSCLAAARVPHVLPALQ